MWNPFNRNTISNSSASKRSLQLITQKGMPFAYVEAYKALRTNLNFLSGSGDVHAFVVTSTVPEEAKSNVSVNLALALTESGKKVVLVDCDLRKPVLHRYLKAGHNLKGVSNVLSRQVALSDALVELKDIPNLTFLPAGTTPPNPSELLSQPQMQEMVNTLRGHPESVGITVCAMSSGIVANLDTDPVFCAMAMRAVWISSWGPVRRAARPSVFLASFAADRVARICLRSRFSCASVRSGVVLETDAPSVAGLGICPSHPASDSDTVRASAAAAILAMRVVTAGLLPDSYPCS